MVDIEFALKMTLNLGSQFHASPALHDCVTTHWNDLSKRIASEGQETTNEKFHFRRAPCRKVIADAKAYSPPRNLTLTTLIIADNF